MSTVTDWVFVAPLESVIVTVNESDCAPSDSLGCGLAGGLVGGV